MHSDQYGRLRKQPFNLPPRRWGRFATRLTSESSDKMIDDMIFSYKMFLGSLSWVVYVPIINWLYESQSKGFALFPRAIHRPSFALFPNTITKRNVSKWSNLQIWWSSSGGLSFAVSAVCLPFSSGSILNALFLWVFLVCKPFLFPLLFRLCIGSVW